MESGPSHEQLSVSRGPILIWVSLVYIAVIIIQMTSAPLLGQSLLFTGLMCLHVGLYWFSSKLVAKMAWIYIVIQGLVILVCAYVMPRGFEAVLIGLFPILIGQSVGVYYNVLKVFFVCLFVYILYYLSFVYIKEANYPLFFLSFLILNTIITVAYATLFFQQVHARIRTQTFLRELEHTHRKVEELTLANERQRMARDLHDTLAQGLAGLIMQLEAVDAHLSNNNIRRAQDIVTQSMAQARRTLGDARGAIDDLRSKPAAETDFAEAVREEIQRFTNATGIHVTSDIRIQAPLSGLIMEHGLHLVSEGLTNIARHAQAERAWIEVITSSDSLLIGIRDNGIGFNTHTIGKQPSHYGLLGMMERTRLIGGTLDISSGTEGTHIEVKAPLRKGDLS
ncbi:sensor histidine kinase [Paenibacillus sp. OAS669]|uniref:sensor histidine kinase n=1 Tax=Paenibacillus sp. OAS669 TaxID=2663821 RepID=UPI00178B4A72|nr:sensor histidine kinase [Paenibacillus sp. OAS669]MBE1440956.1 NarL family two-component system sensor histidine kinase YdfH [Paenibacillus sp. OAS669]